MLHSVRGHAGMGVRTRSAAAVGDFKSDLHSHQRNYFIFKTKSFFWYVTTYIVDRIII